MARFLFAWELGGGLGHVARLRPVAWELRRRGHHVEFALRDATKFSSYLNGMTLHAAPDLRPAPADFIADPSTFADVMHNAGCAELFLLREAVAAWRAIFEAVQPDVAVLDYSPRALLALQGYGCAKALLGTGFACPPDVTPLPDLCPWHDSYRDRLRLTEQRVLATLNQQLDDQRQPPLVRVAELFTRIDENLLATFRELDHYPDRGSANYVGVWPDSAGAATAWLGGSPRVFAYLKQTPVTYFVLDELQKCGVSTIAFLPESGNLRVPSSLGSLRVVREPVDIARVAAECDFAITHAGHGTAAQLLLAGKPLLAVPLVGEQRIVANNLVRIRAAVVAPFDDPAEIRAALDALLTDSGFRTAAEAFRRRYADFNAWEQIQSVATRLESFA